MDCENLGINYDRIQTEFKLREGFYRLVGNRLDLRSSSTAVQLRMASANGQLMGAHLSPNNLHHNSAGYGPASNLPQIPLGSAATSQNLEALKISTKSYYLEGELCELVGLNYGNTTFWYAYRGVNRAVELDIDKLDKRIYRGIIPTCHDLCDVFQTESNSNEVFHLSAVGFSHGQVQIMDFRGGQNFNSTYNEERIYETSKVTCIKWVPNSENEFIVGHYSGNMYHYSQKEPTHSGMPVFVAVVEKDTFSIYESRSSPTNHKHSSSNSSSNIDKSSHQSNQSSTSSSSRPKNPLFKWIVGDGSVNDFEFAPSSPTTRSATHTHNLLAVATADGFIRIFNFEGKELVGQFKSYFGAMLCVAWSGDALLVAAGAEDDLIHVYSLEDFRVILRCQGHKSWVSGLAFDNFFVSVRKRDSALVSRSTATCSRPLSHQSQGRRHNRPLNSYRLGSVSHDTHFCLWDLDESLLMSVRKEAQGGRTRSTTNSVSHNCYNSGSTPRTSESQQKAVGAVSVNSVNVNISRSNSLPGPKINNILAPSTQNKRNDKEHVGESKSSSNTNTLTSQSEVVATPSTTSHSSSSSSKGNNSSSHSKKDKLPLSSMFRSHHSHPGVGSGPSSKSSKTLQYINPQKVRVQQEAQSVFGSPMCPRNGQVATIEPMCNFKASYERLTAIKFMANCFLVGGKDGFILVYSRPNPPPEKVTPESPHQSDAGEYCYIVTENVSPQVPTGGHMQPQKFSFPQAISNNSISNNNHMSQRGGSTSSTGSRSQTSASLNDQSAFQNQHAMQQQQNQAPPVPSNNQLRLSQNSMTSQNSLAAQNYPLTTSHGALMTSNINNNGGGNGSHHLYSAAANNNKTVAQKTVQQQQHRRLPMEKV